MELKGTFTALTTPFNADGSIDFGALEALVEQQLAGGITGLVPCGTTGEAATLSREERSAVIETVAKRAHGKPIIAGTGTNNTAQSVELHQRAADSGATHSLAVTPYYNKPSDEGLLAHYQTIADSAPLPLVLYNVPGRTACDMSVDVIARLAQHDQIVAVKEATGLLDRVTRLRSSVSDKFSILSGDDPTASLLCLLGGHGVVSVASNFVPTEMVALIRHAMQGDLVELRAMQSRLLPLFDALFIESNPIPVKAALATKGLIGEHYRLPLIAMQSNNREKLLVKLRDGGWL